MNKMRRRPELSLSTIRLIFMHKLKMEALAKKTSRPPRGNHYHHHQSHHQYAEIENKHVLHIAIGGRVVSLLRRR